MTDQEFSAAREAERLEAHPEKDLIKKIQQMMGKEKEQEINEEKSNTISLSQDEMDELHRSGKIRLPDGSLLVYAPSPSIEEETNIDADDSIKEHFNRFLKDYQ